jgi:hypothetical protein
MVVAAVGDGGAKCGKGLRTGRKGGGARNAAPPHPAQGLMAATLQGIGP